MSKLFKENGFLSEEGQKAFAPVVSALETLMTSPEVRKMSENEMRLLGSNLASLAGNTVSNAIQARNNIINSLSKMSNEQFYAFLKAKYGDQWMMVSLTPEEFNRLPRLSNDEIKEAMERGLRERDAAIAATPMPYIDPGLRFR